MVDAQPNVFEAKIDLMTKQLTSKNAAKRREAAYFLGEVGAPDAVPALVKLYEKDKDARVRAAAAYALGMYKAVEQAIKTGDQDEVASLLNAIEEDGEIGSRAPVGRMVKILLGLVVSLIALGVIYFMRADLKAMFIGSDHSKAEVVANVQKSFTLVENDTRTLQTALLNVIQNHPLSCTDFFNNPPAYELDPVDARAYPDAADIVTQMNAAQASLASAKANYDDACNNGATFGSTEAASTFQLLRPALNALAPLELALAQASAAEPTPTPAPPTAISTNPASGGAQAANGTSAPTTVGATPGSIQANITLQPTVAIDPSVAADIKRQLPALFNIVDDVTAPRGSSTLLVQYWTDVQKSGSTQGCGVQPPEIPNNVIVVDADLQASPDLRDAVALINNGLSALRTDWTNFQFDCNSNNMPQKVNRELANTEVAAASFAAANLKLEALQNGL